MLEAKQPLCYNTHHMPLIKSAKKKLRKDRRITEHNRVIKENLKKLVKTARRQPGAENLSNVFSALDKAAKTHLIHANKASRLKSRLSHLLTPSK